MAHADETKAPEAPAAAAAAAPAKAPAANDEEHEDLRLRIGFNLGGGYAFVGSAGGPAIGLGFRVGVQVNRLIGAYYQTGANVLVVSGGGNTAAASFIPNSAMLSLTPVDMFEVAAGPSVDYFGYGAVSTGAGSATAAGGVAFGIAGRAALHLGGRNAETGRRSGFTIGVDVHPIFAAGDVAVPITLGLGGDWF